MGRVWTYAKLFLSQSRSNFQSMLLLKDNLALTVGFPGVTEWSIFFSLRPSPNQIESSLKIWAWSIQACWKSLWTNKQTNRHTKKERILPAIVPGPLPVKFCVVSNFKPREMIRFTKSICMNYPWIKKTLNYFFLFFSKLKSNEHWSLKCLKFYTFYF